MRQSVTHVGMVGVRQTLSGAVERFRQPEYTGENRCLNCTVLNTGIALVLSVAVALVSVLGAVLVLLVCVSLITVRGYLIPGTPTLVMYLPDFVHERIGPGTAAADTGIDVAEVLTAAEVIRECADEDDLCLTASYRAAFREQMDRLQDESRQRERLAGSLSVPVEEVSFEETDGRFDVYVADIRAGGWRSRSAFLADLGNERLLSSQLDGWERLPSEDRTQLLVALRTFVETCPDCGGEVLPDEDVVRSCCRDEFVSVTMQCRDCEAVVFTGTER